MTSRLIATQDDPEGIWKRGDEVTEAQAHGYNIPVQQHVTLTFVLNEQVTPDLFAEKVARGLSDSALRPGEAVLLPSNPAARYIISNKLYRDELREAGLPL